jgi:hypothetical protein
MSHIVHPDEMMKLEREAEEHPVRPDELEVGGNPNQLKCPKCGDTPLHYELHVKTCKGKRKAVDYLSKTYSI